MEESSWSLRLALAVLGLAVVTAIYAWNGWTRRRERNKRYGRRLREQRAPRRGEFEDFEAEEMAAASAGAEPATLTGAAESPHDDFEIVVLPPREHRVEELPIVLHEEKDASSEPAAETPAMPPMPGPADDPASGGSRPKGRRGRTNQLSFGFEETARPAQEPPAPEVLALFLRPAKTLVFKGPALEQALAAIGMRFGERNIYHHFGSGELTSREPLFSLANMFEPGDFDPAQMADFSTAGVALFIQFPSEFDGSVAFELFLNAAQRLAERLEADLLSEPRKALDSAAIERMRRTAARFVNAA